jgi:hypothetical protein
MIRHFKKHFFSILAGVDAAFPPSLWDLLLPQAKLTINLLLQATANPKILAWEYFNGPFDFNKTPLAPVGCRVLIHAEFGILAVTELQNESFVLMCTLFLGQIGYLSQTALSQPSQQGKEDLDKDICSNFGMMPSNRLRTGWVVVEVASPQEGERVTLAILVWPQT